jgi:hypothetical protein
MTLIRKASELQINPKIKALIYGQAGMGKTTISISTPKPLIFDFDGGVHRVNFAHLEGVDTVQISSYDDFLEVINEDLSAYDTIVIDTGGKCLDYMGNYIIKRNPKMGKSNGSLTLQGYGERKVEFTALVKKISSMNKHLFFVAHRETKTEGDDTRYVPLFGGSNYDSLVTELDLVGYMEANGKKRTITFDPTSRNDGKNTCNLPSMMEIPIIVDETGNATAQNNFITEKVIKPYLNRLNERKKVSDEYEVAMSIIKSEIELITDDQSANGFIARMSEFNHVGSSAMMTKQLLTKKASELKLKFNKESGKYENA